MNRKNSPLTFLKTRRPLASLVIIAAVLVVLTPSIINAHPVVGDRIFLSTIVGEDAFPDNALDLAGHRSDYAFSLLPALEKLLTDNSSLLFVGGWYRITPGAHLPATSAVFGWSRSFHTFTCASGTQGRLCAVCGRLDSESQ